MHRTLRKTADAKLVNMARNNSAEMFENNLFKEQFQDFIIEQYAENQSAYEKLFGVDQSYYNTVYSFIAKDMYKWLRSQTPEDYV